MKKIIVSEEQMKRLIESNIDEQIKAGDTNATPGKSDVSLVNKKIRAGSNLFKIGSDKINTNSAEFKNALKILRTVSGGSVEIQGGASAVGGDRGYDNQALANRRAQNFITALKNSGVDTSGFNILPGIVGKATKANSPEANAEQFVEFKVKPTPGINIDQKLAIDNTAVERPIISINDIKPKTTKSAQYSITFKFDYDTNVSNAKEIYNLIKTATEGKVTRITNVTKQVTK